MDTRSVSGELFGPTEVVPDSVTAQPATENKYAYGFPWKLTRKDKLAEADGHVAQHLFGKDFVGSITPAGDMHWKLKVYNHGLSADYIHDASQVIAIRAKWGKKSVNRIRVLSHRINGFMKAVSALNNENFDTLSPVAADELYEIQSELRRCRDGNPQAFGWMQQMVQIMRHGPKAKVEVNFDRVDDAALPTYRLYIKGEKATRIADYIVTGKVKEEDRERFLKMLTKTLSALASVSIESRFVRFFATLVNEQKRVWPPLEAQLPRRRKVSKKELAERPYLADLHKLHKHAKGIRRVIKFYSAHDAKLAPPATATVQGELLLDLPRRSAPPRRDISSGAQFLRRQGPKIRPTAG
ncbi:MAG TPA: hypothetical protein VFR09_06715 [Alphaproteobacteria bacterium]|nr:hypothetical protein [Alphaproteobacteria bacterium]